MTKKTRNRKHIKRWLLIYIMPLMLTILLAGCGADDVCLSYQHNVQAGFYSAKSVQKSDTTLNQVIIYGIGREDSALYVAQSIGKLFLNMNLNKEETAYIIQTRTLSDTVRFWYSKELSPISSSCGVTFNLIIDSVSHSNTFIDSVSISHPFVRYKENNENVKIFIY